MKTMSKDTTKKFIAFTLLTSFTATQMIYASEAAAATQETKYTYARTTVAYSQPSFSAYQSSYLMPATQVKGIKSGSFLKVTYPNKYKGLFIPRSKLATTAPNKSTGYTLYPEYNGIKVYYLQKKLGIPYSPYTSTMNVRTVNAVKAYQKRLGLKQTGVVTKSLWTKMFGSTIPFNIDAYKQKSLVAVNASRKTRINTMINFANQQIGKPYIWGSTGDTGYDCSGLLLQAMRAGGHDPKGISNFINVRPQSDLANALWKNNTLTNVNINNIQRGDLIFYINQYGAARHVSLYLGNNEIIHSLDYNVHKSKGYKNQFGYSRIAVKRVFN